MGVSGAGKTTLMDVLAGRKTGGAIEGETRVGGYPKVQETYARISGYCEQTDIDSPQVTIEESVIYSAWLRLPPLIDRHSKAEFAAQVLQLIELDDIKDASVGIPGSSGISSEQRLTVAVELVSNPSIIFMDEPTSYPIIINFSRSVYKLLWYFYTVFFTLLFFNYLIVLLVSITPTHQVASVFACFCYTLLNLFSGYLMPEPQIPKWWIWSY